MNGTTSNRLAVLKILTGPVIWPDGLIGRVVTLSDATMETEGWDAAAKFWVRGAFDMTSLVTAATDAPPADLAAQGVTD